MCGIAGIVNRGHVPVEKAVVRRMTDSLTHRGPDGEGFHIEGPVGLGHRRLSIIDLQGGVQPMASEDGSTWITYNGEVYNFKQLRSELAALGHRFRTSSDTEVVLAAYIAWGPDCVTRLRGMFAFGIWDARRRRLFLARDRVGIKPLVYRCDERGLRFASEVKAILADPNVPRELDPEALQEYFTYHYVAGASHDLPRHPQASAGVLSPVVVGRRRSGDPTVLGSSDDPRPPAVGVRLDGVSGPRVAGIGRQPPSK